MEKVKVENQMLDAKAIADLLGIGVRTLWRWISSNQFPAPDLRKGRVIRWRLSTVQSWIEQGFVDERNN